MTTDLRQVLHQEIDALAVTPGDLDRIHRSGVRIRRRRGSVAGGVAVLAAGAVVAGFALGGSEDGRDSRGVDPAGPMDFSHGLRAYAAPGAEIHLGGQTFPAGQLELLDTDAAATPAGVLYYDRGRPLLLSESGEVTDLEPDASSTSARPTSKVDSVGSVVAYGAELDGRVEVRVRDLASGELLASHVVPAGTTIDGIDDGVVFLRTGAGTAFWDTRTDEERPFAGPRTRVADVRNGVVLYDGPAPDGPDAASYRLVKGAIDAQLTYDGGHVLYWSGRLLPTTPGGKPVLLDVGSTDPGPTSGFWAVDTDGSILTAVPGPGATSTVYDCEVPSGACAELGPLTTEHGDPMFIGVDM